MSRYFNGLLFPYFSKRHIWETAFDDLSKTAVSPVAELMPTAISTAFFGVRIKTLPSMLLGFSGSRAAAADSSDSLTRVRPVMPRSCHCWPLLPLAASILAFLPLSARAKFVLPRQMME